MYERNFSRSYRSFVKKGMKRGLRWNTNIRIFVLIALVFSFGVSQSWFSNITNAQVAPTGDLTICKFNDVNENGTKDDGDTPLQWPFTVIYPGAGGTLGTGTNAESGCVTIAGLPLGEYTITEDDDNNTGDLVYWTKSSPVSGSQTITLAAGGNNVTFLNYVAVCTDNDADGYYHEGGACGQVDCNDNNPLSWRIDSYWYDGDSDGYHVNASNSGPDGKIAICYGADIPTGYMDATLGEDCDDANSQYNLTCDYTGTIQICKYEKVGGQCTPETPKADYAVYKNGYYWAWASPCDGGCSIADPNRVPGWRYATEEEWALRPAQSDFLDQNGNVICAAAYFDDTHRHCDYGNPEVRTPQRGWYESWYIYDCTYEPQQVRAEQNKIFVAFANLWNKFIAKAALAGVLPGTPLENWTIHINGLSDTQYADSGVTGKNGCIDFTVPYGTYRVTEEVKDYWQQVKPGGDGFIDVTISSSTPTVSNYFLNEYTNPIFGCMDQEALNYDDTATVNDGSCEYAKRGGGSEISTIQSTPPGEQTPEQPAETPAPVETIPEPEVQVLGFEAEAPAEETPVQVLGYESLPETGGPVGIDVTLLGTLLLMSGAFIFKKTKI